MHLDKKPFDLISWRLQENPLSSSNLVNVWWWQSSYLRMNQSPTKAVWVNSPTCGSFIPKPSLMFINAGTTSRYSCDSQSWSLTGTSTSYLLQYPSPGSSPCSESPWNFTKFYKIPETLWSMKKKKNQCKWLRSNYFDMRCSVRRTSALKRKKTTKIINAHNVH